MKWNLVSSTETMPTMPNNGSFCHAIFEFSRRLWVCEIGALYQQLAGLSVHFYCSPEISFQINKILMQMNGLVFVRLESYVGISLSVNWAFTFVEFLSNFLTSQIFRTSAQIHLYINCECSHTHSYTPTQIAIALCLWFLGLVRVECAHHPFKLLGICLLTNAKKHQLNKIKVHNFSANLYIVAVSQFHE